MDQPKVSIIIPIYNVEEYLVECLESVCRQTLKNIEILCVNDGSTDSSLEIIKRYAAKDKRIVVLDGPNGGYGKAMNRGLDAATGEYIGIVEPDDYVSLAMYEDLSMLADKNDLDFVKADFYRFTRAENGDMELKYNHLDSSGEWYRKVFDASTMPIALRFTMNTWSGIYRLEFLKKYSIRHHETPGASFQDNGFWIQTFVYAKRAMILDVPYYRNRRDNPKSSVKDTGKVYCMNEEYDYIEKLLRPQRGIWNRIKHVYWVKRFENYMFTMRRIDPLFVPEYAIRFRADFSRARELGELEQSSFSEIQWIQLQKILANPRRYARTYLLKKRCREIARNGIAWVRQIVKGIEK